MAAERSCDNELEMNIRDDSKIVEVWLTREETGDRALRERLKPLCQEYKARDYLVAVFHSGTKNLEEQTSDLLCYNKKRIPELEVKREREQQMNMAM